ncbi:MAG: hypothetical protein EKK52_12140 [Burkholderiales bacterium]|jgi:hypothetical protein|nr:MAG: hypothetical protein EKK52_12140 [Burkholderiales bacterium]
MPLYLEDLPTGIYSYPMVAVLKMMALDVEDRPINPATAAELIRHFVGLMISPEHHKLLAIEGQPTWDKVEAIQFELAIASDELKLEELVEASVVVDLLYHHSTRPPRERKPRETVEVASYLRMRGYAKLDIGARHAVVDGRQLDLLKFCKYCWRPATNAAMVCAFHSVQKRSDAAAAAQYKQAQRLQRTFETLVNRLGTSEELGFHDSEFTSPVFFPATGADQWLALHRPKLLKALADAGLSNCSLPELCAYLYGDAGVAQQLADRPQILTPVTLRAEAWLAALLVKPKWGGARTPRELPDAEQPDGPATDFTLADRLCQPLLTDPESPAGGLNPPPL